MYVLNDWRVNNDIINANFNLKTQKFTFEKLHWNVSVSGES